MILTGAELEKEWGNGRITIEPFVPEQVNPNSYNFRLGRLLRVYRDDVLDAKALNAFDEIEIPDEGYVLEPGRLYLAHTMEVLGSEHYAPTFAARSSVARLGIFINLSASLGDIGYRGQWTLQLYSLNRVRVYAGVNIGQMMWWRPQGEVVLYDGKYQGAAGPRSSEIHVDYEKQIARQRLPHLRASVDPTEVGPKFAALSRFAHDVDVPAAFAVPAGELDTALALHVRTGLAEAFADLSATVGAFFTDDVARVERVAQEITVPDELAGLLRWRMRELFPETGVTLAVRSSGLAEDTLTGSLAGVHDTVLGVTPDALVAAVTRCWRSYYSAPAVAARMRAGDLDWRPRLAVMVQRQIQPQVAGVAFAGQAGEDVAIEYVDGLADELVAGLAVPTTATSADLGSGSHPAVLADVVRLARMLHDEVGHPVDVEWAADDDGVHLIQVRPQTAQERENASNEPALQVADLYLEDLPDGFVLGDVAGVYGSYTLKRGPVYRMAAQHGVATGRGWLWRLNGLALASPQHREQLAALVAGGPTDEVVLDAGDRIRQIVVAAQDLPGWLADLVGGAGGTRLHTVVARDFIRGELGVISRIAGAGLVVEYSADGLMALNRGTTGGECIVVADRALPATSPGNSTAPRGSGALLPLVDEIRRFTEAVQDGYGEVTVEWVVAGGRPYVVDYSVLGIDTVSLSADGSVLVSAGTAHGPLLRLEDDELLARLSIGPAVSVEAVDSVVEHEQLSAIIDRVGRSPAPPVVHAARPYAVLSVLIGSVAGFVFDRGSTLGHLAILLREAGVPAVVFPDLPAASDVLISDGTLTLATDAEDPT